MLSFGPSIFHKNSNPSKDFQTNFLFARALSLVRILDYIWGSKGPNTSQKGLIAAESVRKTLKTFNLTTTNAMLMKLTTTFYLHKSVNRKALRARNSIFWLNLQEFLDYIKNGHICHTLPCVASLVKFLYKLDYIWRSIP